MIRISSAPDLVVWIENAKPGERCVYFEGYLGRVRESLNRLGEESPFEDSPDEERNHKGRAVLSLVNKARQFGTPTNCEVVKTTSHAGARGLGLAHMLSQRLGDGHYLYILERR